MTSFVKKVLIIGGVIAFFAVIGAFSFSETDKQGDSSTIPSLQQQAQEVPAEPIPVDDLQEAIVVEQPVSPEQVQQQVQQEQPVLVVNSEPENVITPDPIFNEQTDEIQQVSGEDVFQKKQECLTHMHIAQDKVDELNEYRYRYTQLDKIFYSPVRNSCIYAISGYLTGEDKSLKDDNLYFIFDVLTGEQLLGEKATQFTEWDEKANKEYKEQIEYLESQSTGD